MLKFLVGLFTAILTLGLTQSAFAGYTVATLPNTKIDYTKRTHIVVSGKGNDLGTQPMLAALAKAKKLQEVSPADQVFIVNVQTQSDSEQKSDLKPYGFEIIRFDKKVLDSPVLVDEMVKFSQIASFHFFGHSAIEAGFFLDGVGDDDKKWRPLDEKLAGRLAGHFSIDAYATLNGCNQGHLQAPALSKRWGIPVAGALTYAHFENLFTDKNYYWADYDRHKFFAPNSNLTLRMKPDEVSYDGQYGRYQAGLPFFKFFCVGIPTTQCLRAMKLSVYATIGPFSINAQSSQEDYLKVVREWLCPNSNYASSAQRSCIKYLEKMSQGPIDRTYSPYRGTSLQCDFTGCYESKCFASGPTMSNCAKSSIVKVKATTFVDEYTSYIQAFQQ